MIISYREALRHALAEELQRDPNVFVLGEEIAQFQGAYKVTEGLLEKFGPKRVVDTPISEAGFVGLGIGADESGRQFAPIVQFDDDLPRAVDHVIIGDDIPIRMHDEPAAQGVGQR